MKALKFLLLLLVAGSTLFFANCGGGGGEESAEDQKRALLVNNSPWTVSSVSVPEGSATDAPEWNNFTVSFTNTNMTTSSPATGAGAVWPSTTWSFTSDLNGIVRGDGVTMSINTLTASSLNVTFTIVDEELGGGRVASLDGEYTFSME